ncbi:MAG: tetratricopeptide repeat protein [Candidatus Hydrogenedentes bacterium]|nr:tetratricopeptide repeat protein [Candidatus Hydrogenedentota bacterium]
MSDNKNTSVIGQFKRALIVWFAVMGLFFVAIVLIHKYGEQTLNKLEVDSSMERARQAEAKGNIDKAIKLYEDAINKRTANVWELRMALAKAYRQVGRIEDAAVQADAAAALADNRQQLPTAVLRARLYRECGKLAESKQIIETALERSPDCGELHHELAKTAESMGLYGLMAKEYAKTAQLDGKDSSSEYKTHLLQIRKDISRYKKSLRTHASSGELLYKLAMSYKSLGDWPKTVDTLIEASKTTDAPADVFFWLGVDAESRNDTNNAVKNYTAALDICKTHLRALTGLKRCAAARQTAGSN